MTEEYRPEPQGSATYDHLSGKITREQYLDYLDRQRAEYGMPPIERAPLGRTAIEDALQVSREGLREGATYEADQGRLKEIIPPATQDQS